MIKLTAEKKKIDEIQNEDRINAFLSYCSVEIKNSEEFCSQALSFVRGCMTSCQECNGNKDSLCTQGWGSFDKALETNSVFQKVFLFGEDSSKNILKCLSYKPKAEVFEHEHTGKESVLMLSGFQTSFNCKGFDNNLSYEYGIDDGIQVADKGSSHSVKSDEGCLVLIFYDTFPVASKRSE